MPTTCAPCTCHRRLHPHISEAGHPPCMHLAGTAHGLPLCRRRVMGAAVNLAQGFCHNTVPFCDSRLRDPAKRTMPMPVPELHRKI
eukprot:363925-Chlamydomonas_euryale.AAC.12